MLMAHQESQASEPRALKAKLVTQVCRVIQAPTVLMDCPETQAVLEPEETPEMMDPMETQEHLACQADQEVQASRVFKEQRERKDSEVWASPEVKAHQVVLDPMVSLAFLVLLERTDSKESAVRMVFLGVPGVQEVKVSKATQVTQALPDNKAAKDPLDLPDKRE